MRDSVDSNALNDLLQSLRIGAQDHAYGDDSDASNPDGDSSASDADNSGHGAPDPPSPRSHSPGAPAAPPAPAAQPPAAPVEVIDLVDSTDEEDEQEQGGGRGIYRAPLSTTRKPITLIDSSSDEETVEIESEGDGDDEDWTYVPPSTARKPINLINSDEEESEEEKSGSGSENEYIVIEDTPPKPSVVPSLDAILRRAGADLDTSGASGRPAARRPPLALPQSAPLSALQRMPQTHAAFVRARSQISRNLYDKYNTLIFGGRLPADLDISWNKRLSTTAGLTHYRRETPAGGETRYAARIELSSKVVDAPEKLERTLVHEMCHCAAWLLDHTAKPPHGPVFKTWAARAMAAAPHLDVSTCHQYEIFYSHQWQCTGCTQVYGRHSRSIDETKKVCGGCRGRLTYLGKMTREGAPAQKRAPSAFNLFVKERYGEVSRELGPVAGGAEVMRELTARWKAKQTVHQLAGGKVAGEAAGSGSSSGSGSGSSSGSGSGAEPSSSAGSTVQALLERLNIS